MADERAAEDRYLAGDFDLELEESYRIEHLGGSAAATPSGVLDLWQRESVLPRPEAERRVREVRFVAVEDDERVVGVFTAYRAPNPQLRMDLWYYRVYVGREHRAGNLAVALAVRGKKALEKAFVDGEDRSAHGTAMELENDGLKARFDWGQWLQPRCFFIGENERGDHIYVDYFAGAQAPPPPGP